jgi:hypothetical protein
MRRLSSSAWLAVAAIASIVGGIVWLVWLVSSDARRAAIWVDSEQMADPNFDPKVAKPAYTSEHPKVVIDEAHNNFHTAGGRYKPFADLMLADGYEVSAGTKLFSSATLNDTRVLVISNALGTGATVANDTSPPAFTQAECDVLRDWVRGGGSLLLISDHAPTGAAAEILGHAFGIQMGKGFVYDVDPKYHDADGPTSLVYSRENGLLGDHPITRGREVSERVNKVVTFTGQSLSLPQDAVALMKLSPGAREATNRDHLHAAIEQMKAAGKSAANTIHAVPVSGAQGLAMKVGNGRVVVIGEAAMLSAQLVRMSDGNEDKFGMNAPGNDDRQFALNVMHWLSGALN